MERIKTNSKAWQAAGVCLLTIACHGCGHPAAYHFKHYAPPFRAIAESNKTYFHSAETGRIIPKDPCASYCEPACFGYEPTCWSQWPAECPGNCPLGEPEEVIYDAPVAEHGLEETPMVEPPHAPTASPDEIERTPEPLEESIRDATLEESIRDATPVEPNPQTRSTPRSSPTSVAVEFASNSPSSPHATPTMKPHAGDPVPTASMMVSRTKRLEPTSVELNSLPSRGPEAFNVDTNVLSASRIVPPQEVSAGADFKDPRVQPASSDTATIPTAESRGELHKTQLPTRPVRLHSGDTDIPQIAEIGSLARVELPSLGSPLANTSRRMPKALSQHAAEVPTAVATDGSAKERPAAVMNVGEPAPPSKLKFASTPVGKLNRINTATEQETSLKFR